MKALTRISVIFFLILSVNLPVFSQYSERSELPDKYKWNLSDMYASKADWQAAKSDIEKGIAGVASFKGKLGESSSSLLAALKTYFNTLKSFYLFSAYASRLSDQDLRVSENQEMRQQASSLGTQLDESTSFIKPEILRIEPEKITKFFNEEKGLEEFRMYIEDIQRMRAHTLSESGEKLLASFGLVTGTPASVYNMFNNAEMPYAEVTLSDGENVTLSPSAYTKYRATENRADREKIFRGFFGVYGKFKNTIGTNYAGKVKTDFVYAKDRNYSTSLEASVDGPNIPVSVYKNLVNQIHNNLPTLQRFLRLKRKMLGVDTLHYYDLYTPIVKKVDMKFTVEEGQQIILNALKPMGDDYLNTLKKAFKDKWIDYLPNTGKRSGAYSSGAAYDIHPYILMNWNDDYESVSTLAHELGHTMHSYYSNTNQPFVNAHYATFVAEIASTCNENLLNRYMVEHAATDEEKLYLLGSYLELQRTTIFRQTLFAEFELRVHEMAENNEPITGDKLSELYYNLVKEYYGNDEGICIVDPYIAYEWEYIPHFINYAYYVYQYSTSLIYSTAFAEKILKEGKPAVDKYYNILKGGSSDYPINLIKKAGIDPLSSEAFELTMNKMNRIMDQIEEILNRMKK